METDWMKNKNNTRVENETLRKTEDVAYLELWRVGGNMAQATIQRIFTTMQRSLKASQILRFAI